MPDEATPDSQQQPDPQAGHGEPQQKSEPTPPWGSDEEFNPEKAWKLIQNLRGDNDKLKTDRDEFKSKVDEAEQAKMTDQQRLEKERDEAKQNAESSTVELARMKAALKHGLDEDDLEFISGKTAEEIEASAAKFKDRYKPTGGKTPPSNRPKEQLRGGSEPASEPDETDPRKLAASIPRK
ncbi:MAG TPA: hypothetical protein VK059_07605 [Nocardioidaceae bacterium]|nr:hypothetical protein [Nocardioidaceae bacterium]